MTEAELLARVRELAALHGLLVYHTADSRGSEPGFPDLVIAGPAGVLFRELKSETGHLTGRQELWLHRLAEAGADAGLWFPHDWPVHIDDQLSAICAGQKPESGEYSQPKTG